MKYKYFEDLPVWQDARKFVSAIYDLTNPINLKRDYPLMDQIRRASLSISLNIAEGFERKSNKDFSRFINTSKASAGECRAVLYIALDLGYITNDKFTKYMELARCLSYQLSRFEKYLLSTVK